MVVSSRVASKEGARLVMVKDISIYSSSISRLITKVSTTLQVVGFLTLNST
jgi:hypothetical protein